MVVSISDRNLEHLFDQYQFIEKYTYVGTVPKSVNSLQNAPEPFYDFIKNPSLEFSGEESEYGKSFPQISQINIHKLHQKDIKGQNVIVAVFDAGFKNAHKIPAFMNQKAMRKIQIGADLVDLDYNLTDTDNHGTMCLSCVIGFDKGNFIGTAPLANAIIFRTEYADSEYPIEELNWWKAAEIADSLGVDIISSSLGYTQHDDEEMGYSHSDLDGETSYIAQAAKFASDKGILVVNSAGNSGASKWRKIGTPADVPEVLVVGAVDKNGEAARFTSHGNNVNNEPKPDISALGVQTYVANPKGSYHYSNGTSFSAPLVAGGFACLKQAFPDATNEELKQAVRLTGTNFDQHDSLIGYGTADFEAAFNLLQSKFNKQKDSFSLISENRRLFYHPEIDNFLLMVKQRRRFLFFNRWVRLSSKDINSELGVTQISISSKRYKSKIPILIQFKNLNNGEVLKEVEL
jgi:subtilisin family serine protease